MWLDTLDPQQRFPGGRPFRQVAVTVIQDGVQDGRRRFASTLQKDSRSLFHAAYDTRISQSNINRFSNFFHLQISMEILYEVIKKISTAP